MWIIADINGWRKVMQVPPDTEPKGFCFIKIEPPIEVLVKSKDIVEDDFDVVKVMLRHAGYDKQGIPIYKYNP